MRNHSFVFGGVDARETYGITVASIELFVSDRCGAPTVPPLPGKLKCPPLVTAPPHSFTPPGARMDFLESIVRIRTRRGDFMSEKLADAGYASSVFGRFRRLLSREQQRNRNKPTILKIAYGHVMLDAEKQTKYCPHCGKEIMERKY